MLTSRKSGFRQIYSGWAEKVACLLVPQGVDGLGPGGGFSSRLEFIRPGGSTLTSRRALPILTEGGFSKGKATAYPRCRPDNLETLKLCVEGERPIITMTEEGK